MSFFTFVVVGVCEELCAVVKCGRFVVLYCFGVRCSCSVVVGWWLFWCSFWVFYGLRGAGDDLVCFHHYYVSCCDFCFCLFMVFGLIVEW